MCDYKLQTNKPSLNAVVSPREGRRIVYDEDTAYIYELLDASPSLSSSTSISDNAESSVSDDSSYKNSIQTEDTAERRTHRRTRTLSIRNPIRALQRSMTSSAKGRLRSSSTSKMWGGRGKSKENKTVKMKKNDISMMSESVAIPNEELREYHDEENGIPDREDIKQEENKLLGDDGMMLPPWKIRKQDNNDKISGANTRTTPTIRCE
jgi:hypothetical protein